MIGTIELDQSYNLELIDKTNREGLIENQAYNDFRQLVYQTIKSIIENEYISIRSRFNELIQNITSDPKKLKMYINQSGKILGNLQVAYPIDEDPYKIFNNVGDALNRKEHLVNLEKSLKNLQKSLEAIEESKTLLAEHAGFGLAISVSLHEIAKIASNFYYGIVDALKRGVDDKKLNELKETSQSLGLELKRLSPLRAVRNEKPVEFQVSKAINYTISIFDKELKRSNIKVVFDRNINMVMFARYGTILQVLSNLFSNSIYWLNTTNKNDKTIKIIINPEYRYLIFADNGPGISELIYPHLFEPGYSLKTPPSGLGLYICKYYLQNIKGDIYLTSPKERIKELSGAQFTLDFHRVKLSKE